MPPAQQRFFEYSAEERAELAARDAKLGCAIKKIGAIERPVYPDAFAGLVHAILGQQVSAKAHAAAWQRFQAAFGSLNPVAVAACPESSLSQTLGTSGRKAGYIRAISQEFAAGRLSHAGLSELDDNAFRAMLSGYRGIGRWTCDMVLIFTFQRKNILSYEDLGIRKGMALLYGHATVTPEIFQEHLAVYQPHATLASLYLWEVAGRKGVF